MAKNIVIMPSGAEEDYTVENLSDGSKEDILTTAKELVYAGIFSNCKQILIKYGEKFGEDEDEDEIKIGNQDVTRDTARYLAEALSKPYPNKKIVLEQDIRLNAEHHTTPIEDIAKGISDEFNDVICISNTANSYIPKKETVHQYVRTSYIPEKEMFSKCVAGAYIPGEEYLGKCDALQLPIKNKDKWKKISSKDVSQADRIPFINQNKKTQKVKNIIPTLNGS